MNETREEKKLNQKQSAFRARDVCVSVSFDGAVICWWGQVPQSWTTPSYSPIQRCIHFWARDDRREVAE